MHPSFSRRTQSGLVLVSMLLFLSSGALAEDKVFEESWFGLYMMGGKIGWSHDKTLRGERDGKEVFITMNEQKIEMARMGTTIKIESSSEVVEDEEGNLISFKSVSRQSTVDKELRGEVIDGKIRLVRSMSGIEQPAKEIDLAPGMLPPEALDRLMKKKGLEKGTKYTVKGFDPSMPETAIPMDIEVKGKEEVDILGTSRTLVRVDTKMTAQGMRVLMKTWVDENWDTWKMNQMGQIDIVRMPEVLAKKKGKVTEVFNQTIIPADRKIENAREARRLRFRLEHTEGAEFTDFPSGDRQKILSQGKGFIEIEIKAADVEEGEIRPVQKEGFESYLASTPYLQSDDERIQDIIKKTVWDEVDSLKTAKKLERWVCVNIQKKNMGVGFATAAEVAKNLEGDCSEHGVLLAALCRAAGIPSRVVGGLVYADVLAPQTSEGKGGFGFHMWTEAYVGEWIALDATLGHGFADATHIALARSALEKEASMFELMPIGKYMGKLEIKVLQD